MKWTVEEGFDPVSTLKHHRVMQGASIIGEFYGLQSKANAEFLANTWNKKQSLKTAETKDVKDLVSRFSVKQEIPVLEETYYTFTKADLEQFIQELVDRNNNDTTQHH